MKIYLLASAKADLQAAVAFYRSQSPGLGEYLRESLEEDIDSLRDYAGIHARDFGYQRILCKRFPFAIYYERKGQRVAIVAIIDCRRDPESIQRRLSQPE